MLRGSLGFVVAAGLALPAPALAVEAVCPSGCPHSTIQDGVTAASAGETVTVAEGTYTEQVTITKPVVLTGAGHAATIIDGQGTAPSLSNQGLLTINLTNPGDVTVTGLTVRNQNPDGSLINARGPAGGTFAFDDVRGAGNATAEGTGAGLQQFGGAGLALRNSEIFGTGLPAVLLDGHTGPTTVEDNVLGPNSDTGYPSIYLIASGAGSNVTAPQRIRDNVVTSKAMGIAVHGGYANNPGLAGYSDLAITGNVVTSAAGWQGILLSNGDREVSDGLITDAVISGNRIMGTRDGNGFAEGVSVRGGVQDTTISGNWVSGYDAAVKVRQFFEGVPTGTAVHFNRLGGNTQGIGRQTTGASPIDATHNWWGCNGGPGASGCTTAGTAMTTAPWLVLGISVSTSSIQTGGETAVVTASLRQDSAGNTPPGNVLPSDTVAFAAPLATMTPAVAPLSSQVATSTLTSGNTPIATMVTATFDGFSVSAPLTITAPPEADSDGDGLSDAVEAAIGTDPNMADTDDDGVADKQDTCPRVAGSGADGCPTTGGTPSTPGGTASTTGTTRPPLVKPTLSALKARRLKVRKGGTLTFTLRGGAAGNVRFTLSKKVRGKKAGKRCIAAPRRGRFKSCVRVVKLPGAVTARAVAGTNTYRWNGKLAGRVVKKGTYTLTAVATTAGGTSSPRRATVRLG